MDDRLTALPAGLTALPAGVPELPPGVPELLAELAAPPRLVAHLRLVHDVATRLCGQVADRWPQLAFDPAAVGYGAATHDVGKVLHPQELAGPGRRHEPAGYRLLVERGVDPALARFASTHGSWLDDGIDVEDLLVSLADKVWKGHRVVDLEQAFVDAVVEQVAVEPWQAYLALDDVLAPLADGADARLAFHSAHPLR